MAYDDGLYAQLSHGGQLVVVQTSNAMFIHTDQIDQQFAISRLRAIETHRYVVVAAINGLTGRDRARRVGGHLDARRAACRTPRRRSACTTR